MSIVFIIATWTSLFFLLSVLDRGHPIFLSTFFFLVLIYTAFFSIQAFVTSYSHLPYNRPKNEQVSYLQLPDLIPSLSFYGPIPVSFFLT